MASKKTILTIFTIFILFLFVTACDAEDDNDEGNYTAQTDNSDSALTEDQASQQANTLTEETQEAERQNSDSGSSAARYGEYNSTQFCGWASIEYQETSLYDTKYYKETSDGTKNTFYSISGERLTYEDGQMQLIIKDVSIYGGYMYNQLNRDKEDNSIAKTTVSYASNKVSAAYSDGIKFGTIDKETGAYTLGFSPGYTDEDTAIKSIKTTEF